ncbi:MAG: lysophospholipid acyltransferase family protein [Hornefia sp.]|nr:lysophospholipid acyltransferase family protein [Hornefia sp.]
MGKLQNIPAMFKIYSSIRAFNSKFRPIQEAANAGDSKREKELIAASTYEWAEDVIEKLCIHVDVFGRENLPENDGLVFISNHQGYGDIIVLFKALEGKQVGFIAKDTLAKVPFLGKWITAIRGLFIRRGNAKEALKSLSQGAKQIKDGYNLVIFPEGTRSKGPEMTAFKPGSFKLATMAKASIVPITINGTYHLLEEKGYYQKDTHVTVTIHPVVETDGLSRKEMSEAVRNIEETIRAAINE